jgi:xanthosine utilization system XapX-like protein
MAKSNAGQQPPQRKIYLDPTQQRFQQNILSIKTKKTELDPKVYMKVALKEVFQPTLDKKEWWVLGIPAIALLVGIILSVIFLKSAWWIMLTTVLLVGLYIGFWALQFWGMSQLDQTKVMFEKMYYEINSQQFIAKLNKEQGMMLGWESFRWAKKGKGYFLLKLSLVQYLYLPFHIFNTENDLRLFETILQKKNLLQK